MRKNEPLVKMTLASGGHPHLSCVLCSSFGQIRYILLHLIDVNQPTTKRT